MKALAYIISAVFAYFVSGLNPAIIMSKAIYKKDIRTCGSGNPGFTNFKRVFGNKYAWFVFVLDILKGAVISVVAGVAFPCVCRLVGSWRRLCGTVCHARSCVPHILRVQRRKGLSCLPFDSLVH